MPEIFKKTQETPGEPSSPQKSSKSSFESVLSVVPSSAGVFTTFLERPMGISFKTQKPNEQILLLLRAHAITNVPWIIITALLILIPPLLMTLSISFTDFFTFLTSTQVFIITLFYYLVVFTYAFVEFVTWYFNVFLVTDQRIVDIDYSDIIYNNVAETQFFKVEEVQYTRSGFLRALFDYGDLMVQTAAEIPNFEAPAVPRPERAAAIVGSLIERD